MSRVLPSAKDVRDLLEDLLGRNITVSSADRLLSTDLYNTMVSLYVDDTLRLSAVVGLDLHLTVFSAAALGLVPPGGAKAVIEDREISPLLAENAGEVCNILGSLLNREGLPHIRFYQKFLPGEPAPTDATGYLMALGRRLDLAVDVAGYGSGKLSIALAN